MHVTIKYWFSIFHLLSTINKYPLSILVNTLHKGALLWPMLDRILMLDRVHMKWHVLNRYETNLKRSQKYVNCDGTFPRNCREHCDSESKNKVQIVLETWEIQASRCQTVYCNEPKCLEGISKGNLENNSKSF